MQTNADYNSIRTIILIFNVREIDPKYIDKAPYLIGDLIV